MHLPLRFFIFISLFLVINCLTIDGNWNYHDLGPDVWGDIYPSCSGRSQSPINIRTSCTTYQPMTPFQFSSAYDLTHDFILINNGHTIIGTYNGNEPLSFKLTGGGLYGTFEFVNFHLHWGENYKSGSEHQVNGVKYAGEIHFVHTNTETSEIAVLSIFMQSNRNANTDNMTYERQSRYNVYNTRNTTINEWRKYFAVSKNLQVENNSTILRLNLGLLMGDNLNDFWRYRGSLTTPPCTEYIIWSIFKTPIMFNDNDIDTFRKNNLYEGYRGPQPLYDRKVYRNFVSEILSPISDYYCCSNSSRNKFLFSIFDIIFFYLLIL